MKTKQDEAVEAALDILDDLKLHQKPDFTPLGEYILVTDEERQASTQTGLVLPDKAQTRAQHAYVIAKGDDCKKLEEGHRIYFGKYAGTRIQFDGVPYWIMKEAEVFGIVGEKVNLNEVFLKS